MANGTANPHRTVNEQRPDAQPGPWAMPSWRTCHCVCSMRFISDCSDNYEHFKFVTHAIIGPHTIMPKGKVHPYSLALWSDGSLAYSLQLEPLSQSRQFCKCVLLCAVKHITFRGFWHGASLRHDLTKQQRAGNPSVLRCARTAAPRRPVASQRQGRGLPPLLGWLL